MTKKASRQLLVLAAVLAGLIVVVIARRSDTPAGPVRAPSNPSRGTTPVVMKTTSVADVKLELLKTAQTELGPSTRNPFQFRPKAPPPAPPRPVQVGAAGRGTPVIVGPPPPPPGPPPLPPIALKYIGVLDTAQGQAGGLPRRRR